jgi:flagellum-specific peptidoglycan hydrolase FlgJ
MRNKKDYSVIPFFLMLILTANLYGQKTKPVATTPLGAVLLAIDNDKVSIFINKVYKDAKRIEKDYGVPVALVIAQAAQETGWGKSKLCQENNNYFGIRRNHENMRYETKAQSFTDYGGVMSQRCYNVLTPKNLNEWYRALEFCNYAGHKEYAKKLNSIILKYGLDLL